MSLMTHYKLNEDAANQTIEDSIGLNTGIWSVKYTEESSVAGKIDKALYFDGTYDFIKCDTAVNCGFTGDFSVAFWMKPDGEQVRWCVVMCRGDYTTDGWYIQLNKKVTTPSVMSRDISVITNWAGNWDITNSVSNVYENNVWSHVAIVKDGPCVYIYVNNKKKLCNFPDSGATQHRNIVNNSGRHMYIGCYDNSPYNFKGTLDDIRIYDHALTPMEISKIYNSGNGTEQEVFLEEELEEI